ncbi:unnamed protein product [Rotaria socialis]|uniref:Uncharacterized protein n=1 Tax=Rotaria socialis TaxID=392032 RepID=A0A818MXG5_9BILA|nr:unnamed protein product [Rotaria socialis]
MGMINFARCLLHKSMEYNVFDTNSNNESTVHIQRWSTRLYILALGLAIIILLSCTTSQLSLNQTEIENPSLSIYLDLYKQHKNINCLCTKISSLYKDIVQLSASYHQICSSEFVSEKWINTLFDPNQTSSRYAADFRATASSQFQILQALCQLSISAVENGLETFYNTELISGQLLSKDLFEAELEASILAFQKITASTFWQDLTLVRSLIFGNQLMPAIETAFTIIVRSDIPGVIRSQPGVNINIFRQFNGSDCMCTDFASCNMPAGFYDIETFDTSCGIFDEVQLPAREYITGWYTGCWPSETLLLSTLEIFYNQTAWNNIFAYINSSTTVAFTVLDESQDSNFSQSTNIEVLTRQLFIKSWTKELNYTSYFDQCQPKNCVFDINQRASSLYIITSLLGLYGGLSITLLFVTPHIVTFIMKKSRTRQADQIAQQPDTVELPRSHRESIKKLWELFVNLNIFKSQTKNTVADRKHQKWSTRLYIILLALATLFLSLYTWLIIHSQTIEIKNPSLLRVTYLQSITTELECPCTKLSVSYEDLIDLQPDYHQVCSSDFVTPKWIAGLGKVASLSIESLYYADFRYSGPIFQLLKSMCDLANDTLNNALFVFGQTKLVSAALLEPNLFAEQLESAIAQFKLTAPNSLLRLLQLTRNITYMNQFLSGSYANFYIQYSSVQEYAQINTTLGIYGSSSTLPNGTTQSCSCANDIQCGRMAALYTGPSGARVIIFIVPGFYSRCYPVESLLPSTLECFYSNHSCLDMMYNVTNDSIFIQVTPLDASKPSRFMINTTINELLGELFIESWSTTLSYPSYFAQCQPAYCSYIVNTQKNALEVFTIVAGLIGGLSVAFRIMVPYVVLGFIKLLEQYHSSHDNSTLEQRKYAKNNTLVNLYEEFRY